MHTVSWPLEDLQTFIGLVFCFGNYAKIKIKSHVVMPGFVMPSLRIGFCYYNDNSGLGLE